jgi:hypothetical protein
MLRSLSSHAHEITELSVPLTKDATKEAWSVAPGTAAVVRVTVRTDQLVEQPTIEITFDKPFLKATVEKMTGTKAFWGGSFVQGTDLIRFSFDKPAFDGNLEVTFIVYARDDIHVKSGTVESRKRLLS